MSRSRSFRRRRRRRRRWRSAGCRNSTWLRARGKRTQDPRCRLVFAKFSFSGKTHGDCGSSGCLRRSLPGRWVHHAPRSEGGMSSRMMAPITTDCGAMSSFNKKKGPNHLGLWCKQHRDKPPTELEMEEVAASMVQARWRGRIERRIRAGKVNLGLVSSPANSRLRHLNISASLLACASATRLASPLAPLHLVPSTLLALFLRFPLLSSRTGHVGFSAASTESLTVGAVPVGPLRFELQCTCTLVRALGSHRRRN